MKKLTIVGAALAAALTVSTEARAAVKVITSTQDLASIVSEIGGDKVTVEALARGYQDPHQVEAKPSFVIKLNGADLLVVVGRELEIAWLPPLITQSRNSKIQPGNAGYLDASRTVRILDMPTGQITRAMGDVHPQGNPHYWLDPANGRRIAKAVQAKLSELSRRGRRLLRAAVRRFDRKLAAAESRWKSDSGAVQGHEGGDIPSVVVELRRGVRSRCRRLRGAETGYPAVTRASACAH